MSALVNDTVPIKVTKTLFKPSFGRLIKHTTLFYETCNLIRLHTFNFSINSYDNPCSDEFSDALNILS